MSKNIYTFQQNVTTSGTPVQLSAQSVDSDQSVCIRAKASNTGIITVGSSSASALNSGSSHFKLNPNEKLTLNSANINQIWIDSTVSGEGVEILVG